MNENLVWSKFPCIFCYSSHTYTWEGVTDSGSQSETPVRPREETILTLQWF